MSDGVARRRWRRVAVGLSLLAVGLPLLAWLLVAGGLRSRSVRATAIERLAGVAAERFGVALTVRDFGLDLQPFADRVSLRVSGLALAAVGEPAAYPFLTVDELAVDLVDLRSTLAGGPLHLARARAVAPRLDLDAPWPEPAPKEASTSPGPRIDRLELANGEIVGRAPTAADDYLTAWRASGITASGTLADAHLRLEQLSADVSLSPRGAVGSPPPSTVDLVMTAAVDWAAGRLTLVQPLALRGAALRLDATGTLVPPTAIAPLQADLNVDLATEAGGLAGLLPRLTLEGTTATVHGRYDTAADSPIVAQIGVDGLPGSLLARLAPPAQQALVADLGLPGSEIAADMELAVDPAEWRSLRGSGRLTVRRRGEDGAVLATAELSLPPEPASERLLTLAVALLPISEGERSLTATLAAPALDQLASGRWREGRLRVADADLGSLLAALRAEWPALVPSVAPPGGAPLSAAIDLDVRFDGPLGDPNVHVAGRLVPSAGGWLTVRGDLAGLATLAAVRGDFVVTAADLPLALVAKGAQGLLDGEVEVGGASGRWQVRSELTAERPRIAELAAEHVRVTANATVLGGLGSGRGWRLPNFAVDFASGDLGLPGGRRIGHLVLAATGSRLGELDAVPALAGWQLDRLDVAAERIAPGSEMPGVESLTLGGRLRGERLEIAQLTAVLAGHRIDGGGWVDAAWPLTAAELAMRLSPRGGEAPALTGADRRPDRDLAALLATLGRLDARLDLAAGAVELTATTQGSAVGDGRVEAALPLGGLTALGVAPATLAAVVAHAAAGPLHLRLDLPHVETASLFRALGLDDRPESGSAGLRAAFDVDLAHPARARGELELLDLRAETASRPPDAVVDQAADLPTPAGSPEVHRLRALDPLRLTLADGSAVLAPSRLEVDGRELTASATLGLDPDWQFGAAPRTLVRRVAARASGELAAGALDPYLAGGAARGLLAFDVEAAGTLDTLTATIAVDGSDASVFWPEPYPLRLAAPVVTASFAAGALTLDQVTATLNGGTVVVTGGRSAGGDLDLGVRLRDVAASLDYGLLARLRGDLHLGWPAQGRGRLSGVVVLERALLERNLDLDREVLLSLLTPPDTPGTAASVLEDIDLDLALDTVDGVRIRNNVADLRAAWPSPLAITGTAALPVIRGDIEVDPGGLVYAYGQVVRLDQARLRYTGNPAVDPVIEATTTSSLDDPTLAQSAERRPLDALAEQRARDVVSSAADGEAGRADLAQRLESGLAGYFGERLMARLGERLGQVTLRPALIFTEADPSARLTVSRDVNLHASVALSLDLRNAERQTYRLDLHGFERLPRFTLQGFTTDEHEYGGTLQQALELGGSRQPVISGLRVDHVRVHGQGLPRRALLRAFALKRGDALPPGRTLDLEVAAVDVMRERGFPDAQATVSTTPSSRREKEGQAAVDVAVTVDPGLATTFRFAGSQPSRAARASLIALYRGDVFEPAARLEMVAQARRYWRGRGYPQPQVTVEVERGLLGELPWFGARWLGSQARCEAAAPASGTATGCRLVTVNSQPGEARVIRELAVQGIDDPAAATALAARFAGMLERVELFAGVADARQRATSTLAMLGYPQATLGDVSLDASGRLTLAVASGPCEEVAEVAVSGLPATATELAAGVDLVVGEPARRDRIARQATVLTEALRRRGYADARVTVDLAPAGSAGDVDRSGLAVHYAVDPGRLVAIADVVFVGQRHTPEARLRRVAALEAGAAYDPAAVDRARRALHGLGLFSRVTLREDRRSDGSRELRFAVVEDPRWSIAYGARWESDRGVAGVVDVADHNLLGRGATLGLRLLYEREDQSVRAYAEVPRLFGTEAALELYGEARHREQPDVNVVEDWEEITLQLSHGFGAHGTLRVYGRNRDTRINELVPDPFFPSFEIQIINRFVGLQGIWDSRDTPLLAARGNFASLDISGSGDALGSDLSYLRTYMQWNVYRPTGRLAGFPLVWGQSLRFGLAEPFGGQELVRDVRFFAGGPYSVRGYATDSLGPQEDLGTVTQPIGGGAVLVINEELRVGLPAGLWGVLFIDAGQVWDDRAAIDSDLAKSVGFGLRAQLPIGIVRGDLAWPLDRRPGDDAYRFYFGFGSSF